MAMAKVDLKKQLRHLYGPSAEEGVSVDVPALNFLAVDGQGDRNNAPGYAAAVEALFALSFALKFAVKKGQSGVDYAVMPLEGLWWADDMDAFSAGDRSRWRWTMMIMQPQPVNPDLVAEQTSVIGNKKSL